MLAAMNITACSPISLSTVEGLSAEDIDAAGLDDWRKLAQALHGRWATDDLSAAAAFLADCHDSADHILEARLRSSWIELRLATYDRRWLVTEADVAVAHRISDVARRARLAARTVCGAPGGDRSRQRAHLLSKGRSGRRC